MSIKFINRVASWEQLNEITQLLEVETTSDKTLPKRDYEINGHYVLIDTMGQYGRYQFELYFDKYNETLLRVSVFIVE